MTPCDVVAERIALGEPLGDVADHAASCERCQRLTALPGELAAVPREAAPSIGFTARMTLGAQHVLAARRRRRAIAGAATFTAVAAGAVFVVTRPSPDESVRAATATWPTLQDDDDQPKPPPTPAQHDDFDMKDLVKLARVDHSAHISARWSHITKPLAPYRALVQGVKP